MARINSEYCIKKIIEKFNDDIDMSNPKNWKQTNLSGAIVMKYTFLNIVNMISVSVVATSSEIKDIVKITTDCGLDDYEYVQDFEYVTIYSHNEIQTNNFTWCLGGGRRYVETSLNKSIKIGVAAYVDVFGECLIGIDQMVNEDLGDAIVINTIIVVKSVTKLMTPNGELDNNSFIYIEVSPNMFFEISNDTDSIELIKTHYIDFYDTKISNYKEIQEYCVMNGLFNLILTK